tara:strand:- start:2936 stop:3673 length:738 start_codon:yes stop_codon:yes gene_type:complete
MEERSIIQIQKWVREERAIIKLQKWVRGCWYRLTHLPLIMYLFQKYLKSLAIQCSTQNEDGRVNSNMDEDTIIKALIDQFGNKIKKSKYRMWHDITAYDNLRGWIPINIKTTTTKTSDNIGNLAMVLHAYADTNLELNRSYTNGNMSKILCAKLANKEYNKTQKCYYFCVVNKTDTSDIIVNSLKGLTILTSNSNNLPFQVCWDKNRLFKYENINKKIKQLIYCLQKPPPSWKETFMSKIRTIEL